MKGYSFKRIIAVLAVLALSIAACLLTVSFDASADGEIVMTGSKKTQTLKITEQLQELMDYSQHYVVVRAKQMGGSHYAYTDALAEMTDAGAGDLYRETNFNAGASLVLLALIDRGDGNADVFETTLLDSKGGVIRDPDVSADGTKVLFSWKKASTDDYHIYELDMTDAEYPTTQLTFGSGHSDIEPKYLPNGNIVFSSNRDVQTVDCWHTTVCNNYIMGPDGSNIIRVGYDQVHTTYPTVTKDGRVLFTRWDYNDRSQMWVQGVFQMNQDGTNQTEVFGNNSNFPTSLLHTRDIQGVAGKYISIVSGHHVHQIGKLCIIDTTKGRNEDGAIRFISPDGACTTNDNMDGYGQSGMVYKYPYAISEDLFLVSRIDGYNGWNSPFDIVLMTSNGRATVLCEGTSDRPASQIVPVKLTTKHNRPTMVNYTQNTGTYYLADVYQGEAMKGVERGTVTHLRVVEIVYRASAIGATFQGGGANSGDPFSPIATGHGSWDVKCVLGVVPVEKDGSALFSVPADTPVYFQLLDKDGQVIQTMRSWSTLMPGETYSCVGCHEDKNTAPVDTGITDAMKKGVQQLSPDIWMSDFDSYTDFDPYNDKGIGFSYLDIVQPILDKSCIECHSNSTISYNEINVDGANCPDYVEAGDYVIPKSGIWNYSINGAPAKTHYAPFGKITSSQSDINTQWNSGTIVLTKDIMLTQYDIEGSFFWFEIDYSGEVTVKVNGEVLYTGSSDTIKRENIKLSDAQKSLFKKGQNTVEITVSGGTCYVNPALRVGVEYKTISIFDKKQTYRYSTTKSADFYKENFDDSSWKTAKAPFGNTSTFATSWTSNNLFLRMEFEVEDIAQYEDGVFFFNIFYDENPTIYINGTKVISSNVNYTSDYTTDYVKMKSKIKAKDVLREGKNLIAISVSNTSGGQFIDTDLGVYITKEAGVSTAPFSLEGTPIYASRMLRTFPLSYLFLTKSTPSYGANTVGGYQFIGEPNKYVNFLSSMSAPEVQKPNSYGSGTSGLIKKIREGHGNLTDNEIRAISCWIDLCVPAYGTYNEASAWGNSAEKNYEEKENKRNFYDMLDKYAKMSIAGTLDAAKIDVTYSNKGKQYSASANGFVLLNVAEKYANGATVTVKVPEGTKYIAVCLNGRMGESIIYVPNGTWTYTLNNIASKTPYTKMMGTSGYIYNMITVRIPTADELASERNLAMNAYDLADSKSAFPHATSSIKASNALTAERNVIDGFRVNGSTGENWPNQCWNPGTDTTNASIKIDFGRNVKVNTLEILLRSAGGDSHFTDAVVEFSDGTTISIAMFNTDKAMQFDLGGKTTSYIVIKDFVKAGSAAAPITEIAVFGTEA